MYVAGPLRIAELVHAFPLPEVAVGRDVDDQPPLLEVPGRCICEPIADADHAVRAVAPQDVVGCDESSRPVARSV